MPEFIREWVEGDESIITTVREYKSVSDQDLKSLRDEASRWAIARGLTSEEQRKIVSNLSSAIEGDEIIVQEIPAISLYICPGGTIESIVGRGRAGHLSYNRAHGRDLKRVKVEKTQFYDTPNPTVSVN